MDHTGAMQELAQLSTVYMDRQIDTFTHIMEDLEGSQTITTIIFKNTLG